MHRIRFLTPQQEAPELTLLEKEKVQQYDMKCYSKKKKQKTKTKTK